jgi:hypothetical protein
MINEAKGEGYFNFHAGRALAFYGAPFRRDWRAP